MELGQRKAGGAKPLAREKLVAACGHRIGRVVADAEARGRERRDVRRAVAHSEDAVHSRYGGDSFSRAGWVFETQRDGMIAPRVVKHMAAIGGENQLVAQALGGFGEDARLVASGGADQEQAFVHQEPLPGVTQMPAPSKEKIEPTLTVKFD